MKLTSQKVWPKIFLLLAVICLPSSSTPVKAAEEAEGADQLSAKLNAYIDCFNRLNGSAHKSIQRYASWVKDMNAGPTGKEKIVYGLYSIDRASIGSCQGRFSAAEGVKPSLPVDGAGAEYIKALAGLSKVVEEMHPYYDRENYKDDNFAKGKQLHPQFVAQMRRFEAASGRFSAELEEENDRRLEERMAQLEKEQGRALPYLNMATMHRAKLLIKMVERKPASADQIVARLDAFEKAADEELQFARSNPQGLPTLWSVFANDIEEFRKAAKGYMRRIRDKTPYSTGDAMMIQNGAGWMVDGSPDKVVKSYNTLVTRSNALR